jgi:hypothetical protein
MLETGNRRFQTVKKTARTRKRFIALAKCAPSSFDLPYFRPLFPATSNHPRGFGGILKQNARNAAAAPTSLLKTTLREL